MSCSGKAIAVDPGRDIGVAWVTRQGDIKSLTLVWPSGALTLLTLTRDASVVVVEEWVGTTVLRREALEVIGYLRGLAAVHGFELVLQHPACRRGYEQEGPPHEASAIAHLRHWINDQPVD